MHKFIGLSQFIPQKTCRICGKKYTSTKKDNDICFECRFWLDIINSSPEEMEVVGDTCYRILPYVKDPLPGALLGSNGKMHFFLSNDMKLKKSNDVWVIGKIPPRFSFKLAPTGYFIRKGLYSKLRDDFFKCEAIGCYDRYHCLLYNYKLEFDMDEPYNIVPRDWITGDEKCPSFVNMLDIPGFNPLDITDIINN